MTNSFSSMEMSIPLSARKAPKFLVSPSILMNATCGLKSARACRRGRTGCDDQPVERQADQQRHHDREHRQRRDDFELTELVQAEDGDGDRFRAARIEQDRRAQLAQGRDEDEQERHRQARAGERQQDAPQARRAASRRRCARLPPARRRSGARSNLRCGSPAERRAGDVRHQQNPDRAVENERRANEREQHPDRHDRARQAERQDREIVEKAPPLSARAQIDIGDRRADQHRADAGGEGEARSC